MTLYEQERTLIISTLECMASNRKFSEKNRRFFANAVVHLRLDRPRVLSEREALDWCRTPANERDPVYEEYKTEVLENGCRWIDPHDDTYGGGPGVHAILLPGYGVVRRWWTRKPTTGAMINEPWHKEMV